ncbi:MAG TPA: hypothetical protein VGJ44_09075 [Kribbellaceae bacterium]|jgi:hypothetical protein
MRSRRTRAAAGFGGRIGGEYDADPGELRATAGPQTLMACDNVPNVAAITRTAHFRVHGSTLTLYDDRWSRVAAYEKTG